MLERGGAPGSPERCRRALALAALLLPFLGDAGGWPAAQAAEAETEAAVQPITADPGGAPADAAAPVSVTKLDLAALRAELAGLRCAVIELERREDGLLVVSGNAWDDGAAGDAEGDARGDAGDGAGARVRPILDRHAPGHPHSLSVAAIGAAFCEPLAVLADARAANLRRSPPLVIRTASGERSFKGGDRLRFEIEAPDFPAHVQVDFYGSDGNVVHLLPNPLETSGRMEAGSVRRLGDQTATGRHWSVGPPYGQELIVAVASGTPLFTAPRPEAEPIADYLPELRRALRAAGVEGESLSPVAAALFLVTAPP
nr:DUF4384 domain-containing protein [Azospirillum sp. SYSU D00513]